ncbi:protein kinase [Aliikangiella marina]|uniref:Protein kinase n=1 Tax=Aliikangiella marina TaxID=1712262 RepID=A0A545TGS7_9GAMM|nr:serine/threonine-protein kinase [Aliikangiella marina]TQV76439.1 protein kinase [Aliikangiella marina]
MLEAKVSKLGPYQIQRQLGSGGMGEVFLARDPRLNRQVAIKCLKNDSPQELKQRLSTEAEILAQLDSENIVKIFDVFEQDERLYLVMEYVDGKTLTEWLKQNQPDLQKILDISQQILKALQVAHHAGIIHRDLKADNILVARGGQIKLTDFGIAKSLNSVYTDYTMAGRVTGSYAAMSPEQALRKALDQRTDFFSFGLLLYRMLTAQHAFGDGASPALVEGTSAVGVEGTSAVGVEGTSAVIVEDSNPIKIIDRIIHDKPTPITRYRPDCPIKLRKLILQLLEKSPARRPPNAQAIMDALADCTTTETNDYGRGLAEQTTKEWRKPQSMGHAGRLIVSGAFIFLIVITYVVFRPSAKLPALLIEPIQMQSSTLEKQELALLNMAIHTSLNELAIDSNRYEVVENRDWLPLDAQSDRAYAVDADQVLKTMAHCSEYNCELTFKLISTQNSRLIQTSTINLLSDNLLAFKQNLMQSTNEILPTASKSRNANLISSQIYQQFLEIELKVKQSGTSAALLAEAKMLVEQAPFFVPGYLSYSRLCLNYFWDTLNKTHLGECEASLNQALKLDENHYQLAIAYFELMLAKGDFVEAKTWLSKLQKKYSGNSRVLVAEAEWYFEQGETNKALSLIDKAIASRENWMVLLKKARFLWQTNELPAALETLKRLLDRVPGNFTALRMKATIHSYLGEFSQAAADFQLLLDHNQMNSALLNDLGTNLIYSGQYSKAIAVLEQAYELDKNDPYVSLNLADSLSLNNQPERAKFWYEKTLELSKNSRQDFRLHAINAQAHAQLNNIAEAIHAIQQFQKLNSNEAESAYYSALVYTLIGDKHSAKVNRERAIELGISPSWFQLSWFETSSVDTDNSTE